MESLAVVIPFWDERTKTDGLAETTPFGALTLVRSSLNVEIASRVFNKLYRARVIFRPYLIVNYRTRFDAPIQLLNFVQLGTRAATLDCKGDHSSEERRH
jgi:hypothetical protein